MGPSNAENKCNLDTIYKLLTTLNVKLSIEQRN